MSISKYPIFPVLIVDDEENILKSLSDTLKSSGINNLVTCTESRHVMEMLSKQEIEVVLLDLAMPHLPGRELLSSIREEYPELPVIIITGTAEIDIAVKCMKIGAFDYMVKVVETKKLIATVSQLRSLIHDEWLRSKSRKYPLLLFIGQ